jgi:hypothetical protein
MMMSSASSQAALVCDRCRSDVHPGRGDFYVIRIEAFADPTPPEITEEDLAQNHRREIEALLARLEGLSEEELLNQVYRRLNLILCGRCYAEWIENPVGSA